MFGVIVSMPLAARPRSVICLINSRWGWMLPRPTRTLRRRAHDGRGCPARRGRRLQVRPAQGAGGAERPDPRRARREPAAGRRRVPDPDRHRCRLDRAPRNTYCIQFGVAQRHGIVAPRRPAGPHRHRHGSRHRDRLRRRQRCRRRRGRRGPGRPAASRGGGGRPPDRRLPRRRQRGGGGLRRAAAQPGAPGPGALGRGGRDGHRRSGRQDVPACPPHLVTLVECGDTGRPDDIDTPADLARITAFRD